MTPEQEKERGVQAARLLNDPLITEAFTVIAARLQEVRDSSDYADVTLRESVHFQLKQLRVLRGYLENIITTGKMAVQKIEREKSQGKRTR